MENETLEKLLNKCGCGNIVQLWAYIDYLENVKEDYVLLKKMVKNIYEEMQELY